MISPYRRQRAIDLGENAAADLRKAVRLAGWACCAVCPLRCLPSGVEIDHIVPLFKGGCDVVSNVQVLCVSCHKAKTRIDMGYTNPPF